MSEDCCRRCGKFKWSIWFSDSTGYCDRCVELNDEAEQSRRRREHESQMAARRRQHEENESRRRLEIEQAKYRQFQEQRQMAAEENQYRLEEAEAQRSYDREENKQQRQHEANETNKLLEIETARRYAEEFKWQQETARKDAEEFKWRQEVAKKEAEMARRDAEIARKEAEEFMFKRTQEERRRDAIRLESMKECNKMLENVQLSGEERKAIVKAIYSVEEKKDKTEIKQQNRVNKRSAKRTTMQCYELPWLHEASADHYVSGYN